MKINKTKKIDFRLEATLYEAIEAMAMKQGIKRGTMVRRLIVNGINNSN